jgi:hypothetical protein
VDVQLARQQWEEGRRRLEARRSTDHDAYRLQTAQVALLNDELRKRVGQVFTLAELANVYDGADDWARELLLDVAVGTAGPTPDTANVTDAAFASYAHRASDYTP